MFLRQVQQFLQAKLLFSLFPSLCFSSFVFDEKSSPKVHVAEGRRSKNDKKKEENWMKEHNDSIRVNYLIRMKRLGWAPAVPQSIEINSNWEQTNLNLKLKLWQLGDNRCGRKEKEDDEKLNGKRWDNSRFFLNLSLSLSVPVFIFSHSPLIWWNFLIYLPLKTNSPGNQVAWTQRYCLKFVSLRITSFFLLCFNVFLLCMSKEESFLFLRESHLHFFCASVVVVCPTSE